MRFISCSFGCHFPSSVMRPRLNDLWLLQQQVRGRDKMWSGGIWFPADGWTFLITDAHFHFRLNLPLLFAPCPSQLFCVFLAMYGLLLHSAALERRWRSFFFFPFCRFPHCSSFKGLHLFIFDIKRCCKGCVVENCVALQLSSTVVFNIEFQRLMKQFNMNTQYICFITAVKKKISTMVSTTTRVVLIAQCVATIFIIG